MKYLLQIYPPAREEYERMPEDERQALVEEYLAIGRSPEVIGGQRGQAVGTPDGDPEGHVLPPAPK